MGQNIWFGVIWCGVICGTKDMAWYDMVRYDLVGHKIWCGMIGYGTKVQTITGNDGLHFSLPVGTKRVE